MKIDWLNSECYVFLLNKWKNEQYTLNQLIILYDLKISVKTLSHRLQYFDNNQSLPPEVVSPGKTMGKLVTKEVILEAQKQGLSTSELMQQGYSQRQVYKYLRLMDIKLPRKPAHCRGVINTQAIVDAYGTKSLYALSKDFGLNRDVIIRIWKENGLQVNPEESAAQIPPHIKKILHSPWTKTIWPHCL